MKIKDDKQNYSLAIIALWTICCIYFSCIQQVWTYQGYDSFLSWDVMGYYLYLPATFIYGDLHELRFVEHIMQTYEPSSYFYQAHLHENGNYAMSYSAGVAILYFPFFVLAHLFALATPFAADGFSLPYQCSIYISGCVYALVGLFAIRHVLKKFYADNIVAVALFILIFATNYFHYSLLENAMTHIHLFMLYAFVLLLTMRWYAKHKFTDALLLGLCIGLAVLMRPSEIVIVFIPILWQVASFDDIKKRLLLVWQYKNQLAGLFFVAFLVGLLQFSYWKWTTDTWLYYSYGEIGFNFSNPYLAQGLISIRKGWLVYTPVMILSLIGFVPFFRQQKGLFWPFILYTVANIYFIFSWDVWWYGGSFGSRALVQSYAILLFPLCSFLVFFSQKSFQKLILATFIFLTTALNLFQNWQYRHKMFSTEGANAYVYQLIFGKTKVTQETIKRFEYKDIFMPAEANLVKRLYENDYTSENLPNISQKYVNIDSFAVAVQQKQPFLAALDTSLAGLKLEQPQKTWLRATVTALFEEYEWRYQNFATLVIRFETKDGKAIDYRHVKLQNLIGNEVIEKSNHLYGVPKKWGEVSLDVKLPSGLKDSDLIKVYVHNPQQKPIFIDDFSVDAFLEK